MDASFNEAASQLEEAAAGSPELVEGSRRTPIDTAASRRRGKASTYKSNQPHRQTRHRLLIAGTLLLTLALAACKPTSTIERFQKTLSSADTLWACEIDGNPTLPTEQKQGVRYVFDYEVKRVHPLLATEVADIKKALLDSTTYDKVNVKSCPMVAQWALAVRNHGKTPVAMVLSPSPCGKALVFDAKNADKPLNLELREGNSLEALVRKMW